MTLPAAVTPTRDCKQGYHRKCVLPDSCGCPCHKAKSASLPIAAVPDRAKRVDAAVGLEWEDPPRSKRMGRDIIAEFGPLIEQLRASPGRWARIVVYASKTGAGGAIRNLRTNFTGIEFVGRKHDTGSAVYARCPEED